MNRNAMAMNKLHTTVVRRKDYKPSSEAEEFIVPLLHSKIEEVANRFLRPDGRRCRLLDIGCGRQPFRSKFEALGYEYVGFDIEQNDEGTVHFIGAIDTDLLPELAALPAFDTIVCTEVLEHVADWQMAFANMSRLLAQDGVILLTTPHVYMLHEEPYDFWRPTPHAIRYFAARMGLTVIHYEAAGDAWDVIGTIVGSCHVMSRNDRVMSRVLARATRAARNLLFSQLKKRWLQRYVDLRGRVYLCNIAVLSHDQTGRTS